VKFTGQPKHERASVSVKYRDTFNDPEMTDVFVKALSMLAQAVGAARIMDISGDPEAKRWAKEFLVGYALLAIGEARSMLLLFSDRLNIHARIHLRSLYEYELKVKLLLADDEKVLRLRDAFAYEMRVFGKKLGKTAAEVDGEIARMLGIDDASLITGTKEKTALGGNVKEQMRQELQPEIRYLGTFTWVSQVSHGSVLALHDIARGTDGKTDDFLFHASKSDNKADALLYYALWVVLELVVLIERNFEIGIPGVDDVINRAAAVNARRKIVTREQEAKILEMRAQQSLRRDA
jgi:hypothetical protein